jgi:hypothetical protein
MIDPQSMPIIENHAVIVAEVAGPVEADAARPGYDRVEIRVIATRPVEGWPNLFERDVGRCLTLLVPHGTVPAERGGQRLELRAKKTGLGTAFAETERATE